jgi:uncharacterized protein with HEPN domain
MRNILVHEYFRIEPETVWAAVEIHLPSLERQLQELLADLERRT